MKSFGLHGLVTRWHQRTTGQRSMQILLALLLNTLLCLAADAWYDHLPASSLALNGLIFGLWLECLLVVLGGLACVAALVFRDLRLRQPRPQAVPLAAPGASRYHRSAKPYGRRFAHAVWRRRKDRLRRRRAWHRSKGVLLFVAANTLTLLWVDDCADLFSETRLKSDWRAQLLWAEFITVLICGLGYALFLGLREEWHSARWQKIKRRTRHAGSF